MPLPPRYSLRIFSGMDSVVMLCFVKSTTAILLFSVILCSFPVRGSKYLCLSLPPSDVVLHLAIGASILLSLQGYLHPPKAIQAPQDIISFLFSHGTSLQTPLNSKRSLPSKSFVANRLAGLLEKHNSYQFTNILIILNIDSNRPLIVIISANQCPFLWTMDLSILG